MKNSKKKWFIKLRGSYLPDNLQGWLTYIPFVLLVAGGILSFVLPILASMRCAGGIDCTTQTLSEVVMSLLYTVTYEVVLVVAMTCFAKSKA